MKRQTFMKSTLCLLMALVCNVAWAQTATIEVSTKVDAPEHMYEIKSGTNHWMTSFTSTSGTVRGLFAFYDDNDENTENAYKIYSVTHQKWVSYTKAASYSGGTNKAVLVDTQAEANAWNAITKTNGGNDYYQFSPYRQDGAVATIYWNWHGGTSSNPYNNVEKTVGFHTQDAASTDAGSRWVLSKVTEFATPEAINTAKSLIKVAPGYPKKTSGAYVLLSAMAESGFVSAASLTGAESLYKTATDIILPENDKAYTIAHYSLYEGGTTRYLNYTAGSALSAQSTDPKDASVFVCRELSAGVYAFVTDDGKVLTWPHLDDGYKGDGSSKGYSNNYATEYQGYSDWNKIAVKKNGNADSDFGHLRLVARRYYSAEKASAPNSSFIVSGKTGAWDRAGDSYFLQASNVNANCFSSAWILTEVEHTNTAEQTAALAEIDATVEAIAHVDANASKLGEGIGYAHYMLGETKSSDAAAVKTAINNATTAEAVNAIKNSFKYEVPQTGTLYALYDATHSVYLDIHHLGADDQAPSYNQLATMNADKQYLYITGDETNGTWKIHSTPEGGNYLYKNSTKAWDSWVSSEGADFNWEIEVTGTGEEITYSLKTSNSEGNNHVGSTTREAGQELYVDVAHANALVFKLVEANVTPEEELAYIKMATKATLTQYTAKLKNQPGYYYCTINGTKVYDAAEVNAAIDAAQTKEAVAEIAAAVKTLTLILPEYGKAYKMAFKTKVGALHHITASGTTLGADTDANNASVFYCIQNTSTEGYHYTFISADGKVLTFKALTDNYTARINDFKVAGMADMSSNNINSSVDVRVGTVYIATNKRPGGSNDDDGCFVFKNQNGDNAYDGATAPFHNDNYTSAIVMTEVEGYDINAEGNEAVKTALLNIAKAEAKAHVEENKNQLGDGVELGYYVLNGVKSYDAEKVNAAIDAATTVESVMAIKESFAIYQGVKITNKDEFANNGVYSFKTSKGWLGATESCANVISTAKASHNVTGGHNDPMFQWVVYKSNNGNYYLYNIGKRMFMGVQSSNNASVPFADNPAGKKLTFKNSNVAGYPIMFSTDNAAVVNHNGGYGDGCISWTGGWNNLTDAGNAHQVTLVKTLTDAELQAIADIVEAYDKRLFVKAEVEGLPDGNPNTHFGSVKATSASGTITTTKLKKGDGVVMLDYNGLEETTIDFTREYRGFEFQGYSFGGVDLGKSFTLTEDLKNSITAENPLVAKFDTTEAVTLFYDDDAAPYRIPAIATTSTGRLIAVSDYRHCLDDIGLNRYGKGYRIDLVIRTSDDNGKTWSSIKTIAEGIDDSRDNDCAYGDAAIAVVGENVIVMAVAGSISYGDGSAESETEPKKTSRLVRIYSANNGEDWEKEDITEKVYGYDGALYPNVYTAFFGSGRLAVDPNFNESGKARIYGSMLTQGMGNIVIYSDDMGLTWNKLGEGGQVAGANEPKIEILPNGQILFSARRNGGRNFNVFTYTNKANNEGTWSTAVNGCNNEGENGTNGETFLIDAKNASGENVKLLLQSQPVGGGAWDRANVSIWYKEISSAADHNHTPTEIANGWTKGMQVSQQLSAYSAMSLQKDGKIAFFFEEAPCYQDQYKYGYCMVYLPLTIEQITKNKYFSLDADLTTKRAINVVLTDAQGNEYRDQIESTLPGVTDTLRSKYPFIITLGDNATLEPADGESFTYTNTVTLPFKVSNENTTVWHNIYWPANGNDASQRYPVYLSASSADDTFVPKVTEGVQYGSNSYNTANNADKISWAVYNVDNGFTFKFKNRLTGKFIQATSVADGNAQNVKYVDEANATAFALDHVKEGDKCYGDYALKATIDATAGYLCSTSATGYHYATHYNGKGHPGAWVKFVEAPDFVTLFGEIDAAIESVSEIYGPSLGQYHLAGDLTLETIRSAMEDSDELKLNVLLDYKEKLNAPLLNMPKAGQFFRIKNNGGSGYLSSGTGTGRTQFVAGIGNDASSIFYYDGKLVAYSNGIYLTKSNDNFLHYTETLGANAGVSVSFAASPAKGKYLISFGGRSFYSGGTGDSNAASSGQTGDNYRFTLEEVTELPFNISSVGYGTLYAPVALVIPAGIKAYTGVLSADQKELVLTRVKDIIPAETAVVLYRDPQGVAASAEATTHNFAITSTTETVDDNAFMGSVATIDRTSVQGEAYTLQKDTTEGGIGVAFKPSADNIANCKAYLVLKSAQQAQALRIRFAGTTGIENSTLNPHPSTEVYDLQGRRVLNPTKGIYIVNGKKVIVK